MAGNALHRVRQLVREHISGRYPCEIAVAVEKMPDTVLVNRDLCSRRAYQPGRCEGARSGRVRSPLQRTDSKGWLKFGDRNRSQFPSAPIHMDSDSLEYAGGQQFTGPQELSGI